MELFGSEIDLTKVETRDFDLLPAGEYFVQVFDVTRKETKKGGVMLALQLKVIGGDHDNRRVFHNINIVNASKQAQDIGLSDLKSLVVALGIDPAKTKGLSADSIVGLICKASVVHKTDDYGTKAVVKRWSKEQAETSAQQVPQQVKPQPKATTKRAGF